MRKTLYVFFLLLLFGIVFSGSVRSEAAVKVKKVQVKSNYGKIVHVAVGKKVKLTTTVTVTPNKAANRKVTYQSSKTKIAKVTSAGYVKGVSTGSCKVTVYSQKNRAKKATISVKVVKPVTKIEFEEPSGRMYIGETKSLKKTVTPSSGSFKSVSWSSSNTKIATVATDGKIKGIAAGSVTIKAKSVEGSGKTASYKLTVQTADSINLDSVEVLAPQEVRVKLDKAITLDISQFAVEGKRYESGKYIHTYEVTKLRNYDNKTYDLTLADHYSIEEDSFVRVRIASLPGNGTKSKRTQAIYINTGTPKALNWIFEVGDEVEETIDLSGYCIGDVAYEVSGLIEALKCRNAGNKLIVSGKVDATLSGLDFSVNAEDEMGGKITQNIHLCVGNETVVVAAADTVTMLTGVNAKGIPFAVAKGGSGKYTFVASGLPIGVVMNEDGVLSGAAVGAGEYEIAVTAIDKEDNTRAATVKACVRVADPRKIIGSITDSAGKAVTGAAITCVNVNNGTEFSTESDENGTYSLFVEEGSYDIRTRYLDYDDRVYNLAVSSGGRQLDFQFG